MPTPTDGHYVMQYMVNVTMATVTMKGDPVASPDDVDSQLIRFSKWYSLWHGHLACGVCCFGVLTNVVNIAVLSGKELRHTSVNMLLTWLAVADLLTMLDYLPFSLHFYVLRPSHLRFPQTHSRPWMYYMLFHVNFSVLTHTAAIWITIALASFRYVYIRFPGMAGDLCTRARAKFTVVAVFSATLVTCIPNAALYNVKVHSDRDSKLPIYDIGETWLISTMVAKVNYWIQGFVFKLIPCILLTLLTMLLLHTMRLADQRRKRLVSQGKHSESERTREHDRTTRMLLAIVALFLITELPQGLLTLLAIFIDGFFQNVYWPLGDVLDMVALLNNSINFLLYCSMSALFRRTFISTFRLRGIHDWCTRRKTSVKGGGMRASALNGGCTSMAGVVGRGAGARKTTDYRQVSTRDKFTESLNTEAV